MSTLEELLNLNQALETSDVLESRPEATSGDYFGDIFRAPIRGVSKGIQGLLEIGAMPIDYLADTNLIAGIDDLFTKITPDTRTGAGEFVATLTQFAVPLGAATKIIGGIKTLNNITKTTKLSSIESVGGKASELVRRAGYYGTLGGVTDVIASVPEQDRTAAEVFGLTETPEDIRNLEGSERAVETLKRKLKFGAEGAIIGGAIPLLPAVGTLGYKYGLSYPIKGASKVLGPVLNATNEIVLNPLSKLIAGEESKNIIPKLLTTTSDLIEKGINKLGVPPIDDWKFNSLTEGSWGSRSLKALDNLRNQFSPTGAFGKSEIKYEKSKVDSTVAAAQSLIIKTANNIDDTLYNIINKNKQSFLKEEESLFSLQSQQNTIFDYLRTKKNDAGVFLKMLPDKIQDDVVRLKELLEGSNLEYAKVLLKEGKPGFKPLAQSIVDNADTYMKQSYAAFNNAKYQYPKELEEQVTELMKNRILLNKDSRDIVKNIARIKDDLPLDKLKQDATFQAALNKQADQKLNFLKQKVIQANKTPEYYFDAIAESFKYEKPGAMLKPGEKFDSVITKYFNAPQKIAGKEIPITNYKSALLDTITQEAKDVHQKRFFDFVADFGEKNRLLFRSEEDAIAQGVKFPSLQKITLDGAPVAIESKLFDGTYFALPEFRNALLGTNKGLTSLMTNPIYQGLMAMKSGTQIAKTVFSPTTQVRNFTGGAGFVLSNGLIGGKVSLGDAWKEVALDIFNTVSKDSEKIVDYTRTGAKTNMKESSAVSNYLNDAKKRGLIDQNIEVNELSYVLNQASQGKINFNTFYNNPIVKKLADVYQGSDNFWKIYADKYYTAALQPALKSLDDVEKWFSTIAKEKFNPIDLATGNKKTLQEAIREVSANLVTNTMPTYSKVPEIIKNIRLLPFGNFVAYPAEILRTSANIVNMGARELISDNPYIRQMGAKRLMGAAATFGGMGTVVQKTAEYVTGVSPETMDAFQRSFAPSYQKNSTLIPLSKPDSEGRFKYINFSYTNPYNYITQPVNAVLKAYGDGVLNKDSVDKIVMNAFFGNDKTGRKGAISEFFSPFVSESIGNEAVFDIYFREGKKLNGGNIYYPTDNFSTKVAKSIDNIVGSLVPGAFTSAQRIYQGATGKFTDAGSVRNMTDEFITATTGVRMEESKPLNSMPFILSSYNKDKQNVSDKFSSTVYSPAATQEQRVKSFRDFFVESFDSQNRMYQIIQDAKKLGVDELEIQNILQQRLRNKSEVNNLMNGIYKTPSFSEERFKSLIGRLEKQSPLGAVKLESQIDSLKEIFGDLKFTFTGYDLGTAPGLFENLIDRTLTPSVRQIRRTPIKPVLNIFPSSSAPVIPGTIFTNNTPSPSQNVLVASQPQQPQLAQQPQNLGDKYALYGIPIFRG